MGQFSVNYQGLSAVASSEDRIAQAVSDAATQITAVTANVATQPSLWGKGYSDKLWKVYSQVTSIQMDITRMGTGIRKVYDAYMEHENQVLSKAEGTLTVKNGFTKSAAKTAAKASAAQEKLVVSKKQVKKATFGSILYDSTIRSWGSNIKDMKNILKEVESYKDTTGRAVLENIYGWMEDNGAPGLLVGAAKMLVGKANKIVEGYTDVMQAVLDFKNPKHLKDGIVSFASMMKVDGKVIEETFDIVSPDSYLVKRQHELEGRVVQAIQDGNYLEAGVTFLGSGVETLGKGVVDVGCRWIGATVDSEVGKVTEFFTGEKVTVSDAFNSLEQVSGINPGEIFHDVTTGISDGVSSALDSFTSWLGGH